MSWLLLQEVQTFAQDKLGFSEEVRREFGEQHYKMSNIHAVLKQRWSGFCHPNYMQVLVVHAAKYATVWYLCLAFPAS
jgi:hypothetical protein